MRSRVVLVVLVALVAPPACTAADHEEIDASGALVGPAAPAPYHAEVIALPAPIHVRIAPDFVAPAALEHTDRTWSPVMSATFESASAVCNDWEAQGADAIRSVPPHSGDYACRVCSSGMLPELAIERRAGPIGAGRYSLTAWVRTRPRRDAPPAMAALLEADTPAGVITATAVLVLGDAYAQVVVPIDLPEGATSIRARLGAVATVDECMLVDDVLLARATQP